MKVEWLQFLIPLVIAVLGLMFFVERSLIENGEVRMTVLEMRVDAIEEELETLTRGASDENFKEVAGTDGAVAIHVSELRTIEGKLAGILPSTESKE